MDISVCLCAYLCACVFVCVHAPRGIMSEWLNKSSEKVSRVSAHSFLWVTDGVVGSMYG